MWPVISCSESNGPEVEETKAYHFERYRKHAEHLRRAGQGHVPMVVGCPPHQADRTKPSKPSGRDTNTGQSHSF